MEIVTVRFQENVLKRMDKSIAEHNFNSRTEFIREAVRDKLEGMTREQLIKEFFKLRGSFKAKTSKDIETIRKEAGEEYFNLLEKRFRSHPAGE